MLNLKIAMTPFSFFSGLLVGLHLLFQSVSSSGELAINNPITGGIVEGTVEIRRNTPPENFAYAKVAYLYMGEEDSRFLITRIDQPLEGELLATWDKTMITDGIFQLRLTVKISDGDNSETITRYIRVANINGLALQSDANVEDTEAVPSSVDNLNSTAPTVLPAHLVSINDNPSQRTLLIGGLADVGMLTLFVKCPFNRNYPDGR